jgi:hypothetical protein
VDDDDQGLGAFFKGLGRIEVCLQLDVPYRFERDVQLWCWLKEEQRSQGKPRHDHQF